MTTTVFQEYGSTILDPNNDANNLKPYSDVQISDDGFTVAACFVVTDPLDPAAVNPHNTLFRIKVFKYDSLNDTWNENSPPYVSINIFGQGLISHKLFALSEDGNSIVIGNPSVLEAVVYTYNGVSWTQKGGSITSTFSISYKFGKGVAISLSGNRVFVSGEIGNPSARPGYVPSGSGWNGYGGYVKMFDYNGSAWVQTGQTLTNSTEGFYGTIENANVFGRFIISNATDPNYFIVQGTDKIWIYHYNSGTSTIDLFDTIDFTVPPSVAYYQKYETAMTNDHNTIVSRYNYNRITVFKLTLGNYVPVKTFDPDGNIFFTGMGNHVDLSSTGERISIGTYTIANDFQYFLCYDYDSLNDIWTSRGKVLLSNTTNEALGTGGDNRVRISGDGTRVVLKLADTTTPTQKYLYKTYLIGATTKAIIMTPTNLNNDTGNDDDYYLNYTTGQIIGPKVDQTWGGLVTTLNGTDINTVVLIGTGPPSDLLGNDGDYYLDDSNDTITGPKANGTWTVTSSGVIAGSGPPDDTNDGVDGNFYIDITTGDIYGPKGQVTPGQWPPSVYSLQGPPGADGADGQDGAPGATIISGSVNPTTEGVDGDYYFNTTTKEFFGPKGQPIPGQWPGSGTILSGTNGQDGADGTNGNTILNGPVNPTTQGVDGDFYINTVTNMFFGPKATVSWPAGVSLVGPPGADGQDGTNGNDGQDGTNGNDGQDGADGSKILSGAGTPSNGLGADGDFYLNTTTGILLGPKSAGVWPTPGLSLIGPAGPQGQAGGTITTGYGPPTNDGGNDGDIYIDRNNGSIYGPKENDEWPSLPLRVPVRNNNVSFSGARSVGLRKFRNGIFGISWGTIIIIILAILFVLFLIFFVE